MVKNSGHVTDASASLANPQHELKVLHPIEVSIKADPTS